MFISGVLVPLFFGLSLVVDHPGPLLIPLIIFLSGLSLTLYSRLFGEEASPTRIEQGRPHGLVATPDKNALPPASNIPKASAGRQPMRTAEIAQPPSVTERTTRLLDNE
jgi:hypothetical protein